MKRKRNEDKSKEEKEPKKRRKKGVFRKPGEKVNEIKDMDENIQMSKEENYYQCMTETKGRKDTQISEGTWDVRFNQVRILVQRGKLISSMGHRNEGKRYLDVYESMYLLERSLLLVSIPPDVITTVDKVEDHEKLESVQDSLNFFMKKVGVFSLDHYVVYSHLKNLGYLVHGYNFEKFQNCEVDEDEDDDEEGEKKGQKKAKKKKRTKKVRDSIRMDLLNEEEFGDDPERFRGWSGPSQVVFEEKEEVKSSSDEVIIPPPPLPKSSEHGETNFQPLVTDGNASAEEIMETIDIIQHNPVIEEEEEEEEEEERSEQIVFSCWKKKSKKKVIPYNKLPRPEFVIAITKYSSHFPSFQCIHKLCEKHSPVPVFFGIVESGHVVFMELNCFNMQQNK